MVRRIWGCILLGFCCLCYADGLTISVSHGQTIHTMVANRTIFLADPSVADLTTNNSNIIYISAKKVGTTTLYVVDLHGIVEMKTPIHVVNDVDELKEAISQIAPHENIQVVSTASNNVMLTGEVSSPDVAAHIEALAQNTMTNQGGSGGGGGKVLNFMRISKPAQIYLQVKVVELERDISHWLGLNDWSALYQSGSFGIFAASTMGIGTAAQMAAGAAGATTTTGIGSATWNINALIDAMDQNQLLTVLAEPNLTAMSGSKATFLAGGEFPILVPQGNISGSTTVEYKKFGVFLEFVPTLIEGDLINLKVRTQVSQLSTENQVELSGFLVPSLTTRTAETTIQQHSGQSFEIAGLLQNNIRDVIRKIPGLGDIPVLGQLFKSHNYTENKTELVIIVTPYLVKPSDQPLATPLDGISLKALDRTAYNHLVPNSYIME
ncbi:MAG: hypothetical protein A3J38_08005 [Gammaproteobacteria bacterium RIFCSPHIGHO2_12_FULL_45_9]|nr:MAG: hypothetical protein A3J38_08005 [Gammaproteobacteria bacterium RIFCSPHIGHO2_12_FULL_45_9]